MKPLLDQFAREARYLSRNPLGIIALFILLAYGIAGLTLSVSSGNMQPGEKLPLVWFLVVFPFVVLLAFYRLVTKHHPKLYAPRDFADKDAFSYLALSLAPADQQRKHLETKVKEITTDSGQPSKGETGLACEDRKESGSSIAPLYALAEDMAFREIENEFDVRIDRHPAIPTGNVLDGFFIHNRFPVIIDVTYIQGPSKPRIPAIRIERLRTLRHATGLPASFLLIVVADGLSAEQRDSEKERLEEGARDAQLDVDVRVYEFDALRRKYGV